MNVEALQAGKEESRRGQVFALTMGLSGITACVITAFIGSPVVATVLGGGTLATLVTVFLKERGKG